MNRMGYNTVIFDMDGTLLDTLQGLADSVNHTLAVCGFPRRTLEEVRAFVGNGAAALVARAVPSGTSDRERERCLEVFRAHYMETMEGSTVPYPGALELLEQLSAEGHKTAIVSNKLDGAVKELSRSHLGNLAPVAIGETPGMARKPAPDMVCAALRELGVGAEGAVYVGDSEVDLETAKNSGLPCIGVSWGFRGRDFLLERGCTCIADSMDELYHILKGSK